MWTAERDAHSAVADTLFLTQVKRVSLKREELQLKFRLRVNGKQKSLKINSRHFCVDFFTISADKYEIFSCFFFNKTDTRRENSAYHAVDESTTWWTKAERKNWEMKITIKSQSIILMNVYLRFYIHTFFFLSDSLAGFDAVQVMWVPNKPRKLLRLATSSISCCCDVSSKTM